MKKDYNVNPTGLKGNEINNRMRELMGISTINENENKKTSVIELTKMGPDANVYAIVRENHEYYIKSTSKKDNLLTEDFNYIGGLQNKKSEAYSSYAKALKHLKIKFNSLSEAYNTGVNINVFENDNLVNEAGVAGYSEQKSNGFSGEGNLEGNKPLEEETKTKNNPWAICTSSVGRDDKAKYEACVKDVKKEKGIDESVEEAAYVGENLTEVEKDVEEMTNEKVEVSVVAESKKLSIIRALENMDSIIDGLTEGKSKKKIYTIK